MQFETYPFEKLNQLLADITPNPDLSALTLTIGEPQFQTPLGIQEALQNSSELLNKYPKSAGELSLKEAMLFYLKRRFDLTLDTDELIATFGTREVLFNFPQYFLSQYDAPVMAFPNPFYQIYEGAAKASRAKILHINLNEENDFLPTVDPKQLSKAHLVILNSPNNPTGAVMDMEQLKQWAKLAIEYDFVLLNDECYVDLYLDEPLPSLLNAAVEVGNSEFKNILVINSISKRLSAPGLRSGFIAGDKRILKGYQTYRSYVGCAVPLPLQEAAVVAWRDFENDELFRGYYKENFEIAKEILGLTPPKATFYIWLKVDDELSFTQELYEMFNLKVIPGSFLGREAQGVGYVRLALVTRPQETREALMRLKAFIKSRR